MLRKGMLGPRNPVFIYLLEHPFLFGEKNQRIIQARARDSLSPTVRGMEVTDVQTLLRDPAVITDARIAVGLTQVELAQAAGISSALLNKIELGRRRLTTAMVPRLWSALLEADRERRSWKYQPPKTLVLLKQQLRTVEDFAL